MADFFFNALLGAAAVTVEQPIDGQTGVWIKVGGAAVSSGMKMVGATVSGANASQYIYDRGVASSCVIVSSARQYVAAGGTSIDCIVSAKAHIIAGAGSTINAVADGGNMSCTGGFVSGVSVLNNGYCVIQAQGPYYGISGFGQYWLFAVKNLVDCTFNGGAFNLSNGVLSGYRPTPGVASASLLLGLQGTASDCVFSRGSAGGLPGARYYDCVFSGAVFFRANSNVVGSGCTAISGGEFRVENGGRVWDSIVSGGGRMNISSGGSASGATIDAGGTLTVSSGGSALAVTSNAGATVTVLDGGYIEYVTP